MIFKPDENPFLAEPKKQKKEEKTKETDSLTGGASSVSVSSINKEPIGAGNVNEKYEQLQSTIASNLNTSNKDKGTINYETSSMNYKQKNVRNEIIDIIGEKLYEEFLNTANKNSNVLISENLTDVAESKQPEARNTSQKEKWIMPCIGDIRSDYGWRIHPTQNVKKFHNGIDIAVPIGTPVVAIADGIICAVGPATGYGYWVVIDHGNINGVQVTSEYGHISKWCVQNGQKVKQGQIIAYSGNTGYSTGPHLHLTIRQGRFQGKAVSPWIYINHR